MDEQQHNPADAVRDGGQFVQCVGGVPYYVTPPWRTFLVLAGAAIVLFLDSGNWLYPKAFGMAALGLFGANARLSPVNGMIAWVPIIVLTVASFTAHSPPVALPLVACAPIAWLIGSVETRLTKRPYPRDRSAHMRTSQ